MFQAMITRLFLSLFPKCVMNMQIIELLEGYMLDKNLDEIVDLKFGFVT